MPPHRSHLLVLLMLLLLNLLCCVLAAPSGARGGVFSLTAACDTDDELLDLCQRCAKLTRSPLALTSCCSQDLIARSFCNDFVYFARSGQDFY